jgi:hypothetical protein
MIYCTLERCALCRLIPGSASCLREQAHHCTILAKQTLGRAVRDALQELSMALMDKAAAIDDERAIPAAPVD